MMNVRVPPAEYLQLRLRAHELLHDVPLYDVSAIDLPGGGEGRTIADIRALSRTTARSRIATILFGTRFFLGRLFRWDSKPVRVEDSFVARLSESDRRESQVAPGARDGAFLTIYQFPNESLSETINATVHGFICTALVRTPAGYRLYMGIYVIPVSWLTRPYLLAIEPFRRILYPAIFRRIRRAWIASF